MNQNGIVAFSPSFGRGRSTHNSHLRPSTFIAMRKTSLAPSTALPMTSKNGRSSESRNLVKDFMDQTCQVLQIAAVSAALMFCDPSSSFAENMHDFDENGVMATIEQDISKQKVVAPAPENAMEEVYKLISKYYIDRSISQDNVDKLHDQYAKILGKGEGDPMDLATKLTKSLGDKYSRTLNIENYERMQKYDLIGVGAMLMPDQDGQIIVGAPPVPSSAADKAGVKMGDFVTAVNGMSTEKRTSFQIIDQLSENPNAKSITMTFRRQGPLDLANEGDIREIELAREFEEVKNPIEYSLARRDDGTNVAYVRIKEFNALVKARLGAALEDLESQGANAYVLDLRGNPGGAFQSAVNIAGFFLDDKTATNVVDNNLAEMPFQTTKGKVIVDKDDPIVIWLDKRSASASEVFAGALHDNCRALTMGDRSFGKGLIQAVYGLKNGGGLVLTVAKYTTPDGTDIQGNGIQPDIASSLPSLPFFSSDTSKVDFEKIMSMQKACNADNVL